MRAMMTLLFAPLALFAVLASTRHAAAQRAESTPPATRSARPPMTRQEEPGKVGPFYCPIDERNWQANFQATYLWQHKPALNAAYTGPHSLRPEPETGYTLTSTLYLGYRPWTGAQIFVNAETIQSQEISHLMGLGGLSNGENQKGGGPLPKLYLPRLFLRQTIGAGGESSPVDAGPNQFADTTASRRFVVTLGKLAVVDIFDANAYSHDPRTSFVNWALWTYGASDFAADSRGYSVGGAVEYYHDAWVFRLARFAQPKESNGLPLDYNVIAHFGDNLEIEHSHVVFGQPGKVRLNGFHNRAVMGSFRSALEAARRTGGTPAVADVRRLQSKLAFGINVEQAVTRDAGLFSRFSWNDGRTETYAYAEIERSFAIGGVVKGRLWRRPDDALGIAYAVDGLSAAHRDYLAAGGLGFFIGDGTISYGPEQIVEGYYTAKLFNALWVAVDGQLIANPAYNRNRGPAKFLTFRFHTEF
jgi:high affinity Mn2+ porin